ncbi:MBL fold metallo-hydrolase [Pyrococcus woesei]|uniref:MBL fold metallo-hydrolase n=1 Tax=Pyrococcus woesei TaxID=2262 RepID=UPI003D2EDFDA
MIYRIRDGFVNVYIIDRGDHLVLIDTGIEGTCEKILEKIKELKKPLKTIIITHHHLDHTGSLKCVKDATGAKVVAHKEEVKSIEERTDVKVDVPVKDGDVVEGLKVFHKPGHTKGSICLLDEESGALFVGDIIIEKGGKLYEVPHQYSEDPMRNRESIKEILNIDFKSIYPAHGEPLLENAKERVKELIEVLEQEK